MIAYVLTGNEIDKNRKTAPILSEKNGFLLLSSVIFANHRNGIRHDTH